MTVTAMQPAEAAAEETTKRRPPKLIAMVLVLALVAGGAWFFLLRPAPTVEGAAPEPGVIERLDPLQINLAGGHYLRVGVALQLTTGAHEVDGSKALDATIDVFTGLSLTDVATKAKRNELRAKLTTELEERYHGDVMSIYFTEFVTQ